MAISEKFFILVGGLGTRLQSVVSNIPKPMALINEKPFLFYKIQQLKHVGFNRFVFCSGYLSSLISEYFGDGSKFDVSIEYSVESEPLGTGGAIKNAQQFIDGPFFLGNGDTYLNFNPLHFQSYIKHCRAKYCMLLTTPHESGQEGMVRQDYAGKIIEFLEKVPPTTTLQKINAGIYYLSPEILDFIPQKEKISLEKYVFPRLIDLNASFYGFDYEGYFIDIGNPKNYAQFIEDVKSHKVAN